MTDITIVFAYLLLTLIVGIWVGNSVGSSEDYKTGGRQYPAWIIFITLSASFIGGGFTFGLAEKTFLYGSVYIIAIFGFSLKEILVALLIAPRMQSFKTVFTVGDIMEKAFGVRAKVITGFASILVCIGIIGAQISACGSIIHTFFGPPPAIGALLAASIVIIYATLGGMKSVVAVDILHFSIFTLIIPIILFLGLPKIGGIIPFYQAITTIHPETSIAIELKNFIILFISFFLGETLIPPYVQRLLIGKTTEATKRGTLWSGLFSIYFFFIVGCIGIVAFMLDPHILPSSALPHVIQTVMPIGLKGLAVAALLAIIMSSVDSFLNSITIAFSHDILQPLGIIAKSKNKELLLTRLMTLMIGIVAIIISLKSVASIDILLYSYQFWTPFILTPFIAAILGIRSSDKAFLISAIIGITATGLWNFINSTHQQTLLDGALEGTIFGVVVNSVAFIIYHRYFSEPVISREEPSI